MTTKEILPCKTENLIKAKWKIPSDAKMLLDICMSKICKCEKPDITFKNKKWEEIYVKSSTNMLIKTITKSS